MTTAGHVTQLVQLDDEKTSIPIISMKNTSNVIVLLVLQINE